ncbi:MAG: phenylalanine--tRNA ligase subunit beta [Candidatus Marsarchaeota archaeon]|nr:phenylalanine--tRNA ligase subunit beta [Candidatus Marsarchaeota archaeon]
MATTTFSLADLKAEGIGADALARLVPALGMEIEEMSGSDVTIDITPNRPDMLDFIGFVRAMHLFSGKRRSDAARYAVSGQAMHISVSDSVAKVRPYILGLVARGANLRGDRLRYMINFTDKLADTYGRRRMKFSTGMYDLDQIKGPLSYAASRDGSFVPLESSAEMSFGEVLSEHPKGLAYGYTLKGGRGLVPFISDGDRVLAMVPIVNSSHARVTESTRNLFVDVTGTSMPAAVQAASLIACSLIDSGAVVSPCVSDYSSGPVASPLLDYRSVSVSLSRLRKTLGVAVDAGSAVSLASRMGYTADAHGTSFTVGVPPYRLDVLNDQDVIEDVAISLGYDKINPVPVVSASVGRPDAIGKLHDSVSLLMIGMGFSEAINQYLTNERECLDLMRRQADQASLVRVEHAKTENISMLRTSVLPCLVRDLGRSAHEKMPQRLFEVGSAFAISGGRAVESYRVAFLSEHSKADFSEAKGVVLRLLALIGASGISVDRHNDGAFIEGRCAAASSAGKTIAVFGELHPEVLTNFGLEEPAAGGELILVEEREYQA